MIVTPFSQTTYGVLVLGLRETGAQIALKYPMPQRVRVHTAAGMIDFISTKKPPPGIVGSTEDDSPAFTLARRRSEVAIEPLLTANSDTKPYYEDSNLKIHYHFNNRPLVPGQVFTAFLASNTFCSDHEEQERGVSVEAFGSDRQVRIRVDAEPAGRGMGQSMWRLARIALRTLWQEIVMGFRASRGGFVDRPR